MKAEDILPDRQDRIRLGGVEIRKGSVGAFIANARLLLEEELPAAQRRQAEEDLRALLPAIRALGLLGLFRTARRATARRRWRIGENAAGRSRERHTGNWRYQSSMQLSIRRCRASALTDRRAHRHVREAAVAALDDVLGLEVQGAILEAHIGDAIGRGLAGAG
ncbi:hypothetical protein P4129_05320 [Pseudomonas aeruginosa]|nr:hypothetical protein [Pseudomonas aeruginosa]